MEEALSPPPISLSAPELSARCVLPFKSLRNSVSSTELLHERAMARFYKAVAMEEQQNASKERESKNRNEDSVQTNIPINNTLKEMQHELEINLTPTPVVRKTPTILIKSDSSESKEYKYDSRQPSLDSATSDSKWQNLSFEEDYTASTVSTDDEELDRGSLNGDIDRTSQYSNEEETYNPRGKPLNSSLIKEIETSISDDNDDSRVTTPTPLPDPNFVPKPILKRRELDVIETEEEKPKKQEKGTLFKKFTKMPVQKPFAFPKILQKKQNIKITEEKEEIVESKPVKTIEEKVEKDDEGKTIIDYYGSIVKEFGSNKKSNVPLYLNTEDLKSVAEKQQEEKKDTKQKSKKANTNANPKRVINRNKNPQNCVSQESKQKPGNIKKPKIMKKDGLNPSSKSTEKSQDKCTQQIILKTTERATVIIPIDYEELEQQAKANVRSVIDYVVDTCLLLLAFWVYLFKDERLAIPFLLLVIHRQLQDTFLFNIPQWIARHTPRWLKPKKS